MTVADRIRIEREKRGWSQDELAARCGYKGKSSISIIETSGDDISSRKIEKVSAALGVSIPYLMGWSEIPQNYMRTTDDEYVVIEAFRAADEMTQKMVLRLLHLD